MRILFLTSFYSGLKKSIETGLWKPTGMPAIYKLIERLEEKDIPFDYCFIDKTAIYNKEYKVDYFENSKFYVVGCKLKNNLPEILTKVFARIIYLRIIYSFLKQIKAKKYDVVYIDRSNVSAFLVIHYFFKIKGVLRLHGIGLQYLKFRRRRGYFIKNILNFFSYKLPFKYIIASRDGTPVNEFLSTFTSKKSKKVVLLNGVDFKEGANKKEPIKNQTINFLFVGRLEKDKGIIEIIECFKKIKIENKTKSTLRIIGGGSLEHFVKKESIEEPHINFLGTISHKEVKEYYKISDVFISFNHLGNISNVVLEAIKYNLLIITFEKDLNKEKDVDSNRFLGDNVLYVKREEAVKSLARIIDTIVVDDKVLTYYKQKVQENLFDKISSWETRIDEEIKIIKSN